MLCASCQSVVCVSCESECIWVYLEHRNFYRNNAERRKIFTFQTSLTLASVVYCHGIKIKKKGKYYNNTSFGCKTRNAHNPLDPIPKQPAAAAATATPLSPAIQAMPPRNRHGGGQAARLAQPAPRAPVGNGGAARRAPLPQRPDAAAQAPPAPLPQAGQPLHLARNADVKVDPNLTSFPPPLRSIGQIGVISVANRCEYFPCCTNPRCRPPPNPSDDLHGRTAPSASLPQHSPPDVSLVPLLAFPFLLFPGRMDPVIGVPARRCIDGISQCK